MIDKILSGLAAAAPGIVKLVELFGKKKKYTSAEIDAKAKEELTALAAWRAKVEEERKRVLGEK